MNKPYHGAGILIWTVDEQDNIMVFLGKRSINPAKGKWSIPGGGWDEKKDLYNHKGKPNYLKTALRETSEEIYYSIEDINQVANLWKIHIPYFNFEVYSLNISKQRNFNCNFEFSEMKWFLIDSLPSSCIIFLKSQVSRLKKQLKNR
ncbi:MAG: NUDIX hydrolase [Spirochaetaceae bacterium]|nr:NUDIX hydrolase [Spirochaetaceae bacterium]